MSHGLSKLRISLLERPSNARDRGRLVDMLLPLLRQQGARVELIDVERGRHRLDVAPTWDVVVLKSGATAPLHFAAAAEAWGIPCLNGSEATRLSQDRLAVAGILRRAGLPIPSASLVWLDRERHDQLAALSVLEDQPRIIKAARGSRGAGLWPVMAGDLRKVAATLPTGPYLIMEWIEHADNDLKVFVAGDWLTAIERPFPARSLAEKRGRPATIPHEVEAWAGAAGQLLGLTCFGCDFIRGATGWALVDVNAFPGYKGADGGAAAIAAEIVRAARGGRSP